MTYSWTGAPETHDEPVDDSDYYAGESYTVDNRYYEGYEASTSDEYGNVTDKYVFSGWKLNGKGEALTGDQIMPVGGANLMGVWEHTEFPPDTWTVTYVANNGTEAQHVDNNNGDEYINGSDATVLGNDTTKFTNIGYTFNGWNTAADGTGTAYAAENTIVMTENVTLYAQWTVDPDQTKNLKATVDYKLGDEVQTADRINLEATVQVLQPDTLSTEGVGPKTYTGWKLYNITINGEVVESLPGTVNNNDAVVYNYVKDDGAKHELSATVNYFYGETLEDAKAKTEPDDTDTTQTASDWIGEALTLTVIVDQNKFSDAGYKWAETSGETNLTLAAFAESDTDNVVNVYFIKDDSQTKTISYTVEYYKDGVKDENATETVSKSVWVNDPDTLTLDQSKVNTNNKYGEDYVFESSDPAEIPENVQNGATIKIYYVSDKNHDGIPDKYQVFVNFEAKGNGTVANAEGTEADNDATKVYTLKDGEEYVTTGTITIVNEGFTVTPAEGYAFDIWTEGEGTDAVNPFASREVTGGTTITFYANFAEDNNNTNIPDKYEATIKYNVVNGYWTGNDDAQKVYVVPVMKYDTVTGAWTETGAKLADTTRPIPTGMVPAEGYIAEGAAWDNEPDGATVLEANKTYEYTFTFNTVAAPGLEVTKELTSVNGKAYEDGAMVKEDDELTYTITVTNTGNVTLTNISVTDTLTAGDETLSGVELSQNTIESLAPNASETVTATYKVKADDAGKTLKNTVVASDGTTTDEPDNPPEVTVENPSLTVEKTADKVSANVGEEITYTVTIVNDGNVDLTGVTISDAMFNMGGENTMVGSDGEELELEITGLGNPEGPSVYKIESIPVGATVTLKYSYTATEADAEAGSVKNTIVVNGDEEDEVTTTVTDYSLTIMPADIVAYTGGQPYSQIVNGSGDVIGTASSGLPEPGYHIVLSGDANEWLTAQTGNFDADDLSDIIQFTYDVDGESRVWALEYMGVYSVNPATGSPSAYVYKLNTVEGEYDVRLQYKDGEHTYIDSDDIPMTADSVNKQYTMSIYPGDLNQGLIKATLAAGGENISANVKTGTGTLTVLSTVTDGNTTTKIDAAPDPDNMVAHENGDIKYFVNDSQVEVAKDRVELLVDNISNSAEFNESVGEDAMSWLEENYDADFNDAGYEVIYFDLVDTANGNAKVSFTGGDLTIYWPVPEDNEGEDFYVVHYTGMDRTETDPSTDVAAEPKELHATDVVTVDGEDYVVFNVSSFSPFVLVYDTDDGYRPPKDDEEDEDLSGLVPNWLNVDDHYAYIVGYEDGEIKPNNNITRAEVATIFFRLLTDDARAEFWSTENDYSDVAPESWYNNAISTLSNMDIINGYEDGTFKPNAQHHPRRVHRHRHPLL